MHCDEAKKRLVEYARNELSDAEREKVQSHLNGCGECSRELEKVTLLVSVLSEERNITYEPPPAFGDELHKRLAEANLRDKKAELRSEKKLYFLRLVPPLALAAVLLLVFGVALGFYLAGVNRAEQPLLDVSVTTAVVPVNHPLKMKISYESETRLGDVSFSIELPEGIIFETDDAEIAALKSLKWRGTLEKGKTVIPFAVRAISPGDYKIIARAEKEGLVHNHEIVLKVQGS
ncbi:MAG: hypothetical protein Kow0090_09210 [Myxococcota bacterium]